MSTLDIRRSDARPHTKIGWLDSHHSFSFGNHYDPQNTHHGLLLVSNDDRVAAGTGIWHSEMNPSKTEDVHFVQMWVLPDTERVDPGYEQLDINAELDRGGLHPIASGQGHDSAISLRQRDAVLWGGRLKAGEAVVVPDGPHAHLFVAAGSVDLEGAGTLDEGDAVRLAAAGSPRLTAGSTGAEVLIWVTA